MHQIIGPTEIEIIKDLCTPPDARIGQLFRYELRDLRKKTGLHCQILRGEFEVTVRTD